MSRSTLRSTVAAIQVTRPETEAADRLGGARQNVGRDLVGGADPAPDRPVAYGVEAGPECQQQHRQGAVGRGPVTLCRPDQRSEDEVFSGRIAGGAVRPVQQGCRIPEQCEGNLRRGDACMENVGYRTARGLGQALFQSLGGPGWIDRHRSVLITGPCGGAKSWLACAPGHDASRADCTLLYHRLPRLFSDLELSRGDGRFDRLFLMDIVEERCVAELCQRMQIG
jgi:hypothetical protein